MNKRVSSAEFGSASILPISWMYIRMMGGEGLRKASEVSLLSANWLANEIDTSFKVLYKQRMVVLHMNVFLIVELYQLQQKMSQRD